MTLEATTIDAGGISQRQSGARSQRLLLIALCTAVAWIIAWYGETSARMVGTWTRSETFAHGFVVLPISIWIMWRERDRLAQVQLVTYLPALIGLVVVGFCWLVASLGGAGVVQEFCLVATVVLLVWGVLGTAFVRAAAFPLAFLVFAVPFGDFLLPTLMELTAGTTVWALRLTGIPVFREGLMFSIPSGDWSVVEACSGLRYLIASVMLGVLFAYLSYRSTARRLTFIIASMIVPIVANWVRAYMIVMLGHLSGNRIAVGVDHLIYGWFFFGVVVFALFWVGSYWREDHLPAQEARNGERGTPRPMNPSGALAVLLAAVGIAGVWPIVAAEMADRPALARPDLTLPEVLAEWTMSGSPHAPWRLAFKNANAEMHRSYRNGERTVGIRVSYYERQRDGADVTSYGNALVGDKDGEWTIQSESFLQALPNLAVRETRLRSSQGRVLLVWQWYWIDGSVTTRRVTAKILQARARLLRASDAGAFIVAYAPLSGWGDENGARNALKQFVEGAYPEMHRSLAELASGSGKRDASVSTPRSGS